MRRRHTKLHRWMAIGAMVLLLNLIAAPIAQAITSASYSGTSIPGRTSWLILDCAGGTRVNTCLGNLTLPRLDLHIPGRGLPLEIALTYNANRGDLNGNFGF